jgi:cytochrome c-type biogenesis protein CcmH/NrfG
MLGELLLDQNRPGEALHEFKASLQQEPNRFWSLYGMAEAAKRAGDGQLARQYFAKLLAIAPRADQPGRPQLVEARQATDKSSLSPKP